jgi:hypothetical protein
MGPSRFTENKRGNIMLEAQTPEDDVIEFEEDIKEKKRLIENYFLAVRHFLLNMNVSFLRILVQWYPTSLHKIRNGSPVHWSRKRR